MFQIVAPVLFIAFPLLVAFGAASDLLTMTIPNRLALAAAAAFVVIAPVSGMDWQAFALHFAAGALVLVIGFACFAAGWIGGGDAKFAAVIALWLGFGHMLEFIVGAGIWGGLLTLVMLGFRRMPLPAFAFGHPWIERLHDSKSGIPYGVALAVAALILYPQTAWIGLAA